jgi:ribosome biogenesis GTPase / thiamine phosphate phosphatase
VNELVRYGESELVRDAFAASGQTGVELGRVVAVHYGGLLVRVVAGAVLADPTGPLRRRMSKDNYRLVVGDWVVVKPPSGVGRYSIVEQLPRTSVLSRKAAGDAPISQAMCANVDVAIIVLSLHNDFSSRRLERYLAIVQEGGVTPIVVLTKADVADDLAGSMGAALTAIPEHALHVTSTVSQLGFEALDAILVAGKTYVLLGSSGVGKSTLLNRWHGGVASAVGETRARDGKGRHTTTHRELFLLASGAIVIDTPGMREVGLLASENALEESFVDIFALAPLCKFADCMHVTEPQCAVLHAAQCGNLERDRLHAFYKLRDERVAQAAAQTSFRRKR